MVTIELPPLRARCDDIPLLAEQHVRRLAQKYKWPQLAISPEALRFLCNQSWPGNIRELQNIIERAVILSRGLTLQVPLSELRPPAETVGGNGPTLEAAEREHILRALQEAHWVVGGPAGAATRLGMRRTTLQSKMRKLGLTRPR